MWLVQVAQRKIQNTKNRNVLFKRQSQYKMNNKTNKQRKEEQSLVLFHLPHKSLILKVIKRYIHVAYHVHIGKCLQSVETLECRIRGVIVCELTTSELNFLLEPQSGETKDIYFFSTKHTALRSKTKDWFAQY